MGRPTPVEPPIGHHALPVKRFGEVFTKNSVDGLHSVKESVRKSESA